MSLKSTFHILFFVLFFTIQSPADACTCLLRNSTPLEQLASSRSVFRGKVLYTDASLRYKSLQIRSVIRGWFDISSEYVPRAEGVSVTFRVLGAWKGVSDDIVTVITGYGGGDCGFPFEQDREYLVYVKPYDSYWFDVDICSRTQAITDGAIDLRVLGNSQTLRHRSAFLYFLRSHGTLASLCGILLLTGAFLLRRRKSSAL